MTTVTKTQQPADTAPALGKHPQEDVEVRVGEMTLAEGSGTLRASGVGSCVVVTLYDRKRRIAVMAHSLLPSAPSHHNNKSPAADAKYVDAAIDAMLAKISVRGVTRKDLEAKIVGGANMFAAFQSNVGADNVAAAKAKLKAEGIELVGEVVGGHIGRSVEFCVASGLVTTKTKF